MADRGKRADDVEALAREWSASEHEEQARAQAAADQAAADLDRAQADADREASDVDQLASDADRALADRDQHAADRDQAAADWERGHVPASPATREAHERSAHEREGATQERGVTAARRTATGAQRLLTASRRDDVARMRDLTAAARDHTARARDEAAAARDLAAEAQERDAVEAGSLDGALTMLRDLRATAAAARRAAAAERAAAAADREAAADDRRHAARDRQLGGLDELTGVYRRGPGELALAKEIERARRARQPLALAIFDVDDLKAVNDRDGHAAGDALLHAVATAIVVTVRAYDVTVRWGGDEFVCAMSDTTAAVAEERIAHVREALRARRPAASVSSGRAELRNEDTVETLVARADAALYGEKAERGV